MSSTVLLYALLLVFGFAFIANNASLILRTANMDMIKTQESKNYNLERRSNLLRPELERLSL